MKSTQFTTVVARITLVVPFVLLTACSHPLILGRMGDDLENADTFALCRARQSIYVSQAVIDAIRRRQIDCSVHAGEIAAQRRALINAADSMATPPVVVQTPTPAPTYQYPRTTQCNQYGKQVTCTTY